MNLEARFAYRFNLCMACCEMRLGCLHSRMPCIWWHDVLGKPLEHVAYVLLNEAFRNDACSCIATIVASLTLHLEGEMVKYGGMWFATLCWNATWLILPVVICLSQRLSHACVSMN